MAVRCLPNEVDPPERRANTMSQSCCRNGSERCVLAEDFELALNMQSSEGGGRI